MWNAVYRAKRPEPVEGLTTDSWLLTPGFLFVVVHAAQLLPVVPGYRLAEKLAVTRGHVCELDTYTET